MANAPIENEETATQRNHLTDFFSVRMDTTRNAGMTQADLKEFFVIGQLMKLLQPFVPVETGFYEETWTDELDEKCNTVLTTGSEGQHIPLIVFLFEKLGKHVVAVKLTPRKPMQGADGDIHVVFDPSIAS